MIRDRFLIGAHWTTDCLLQIRGGLAAGERQNVCGAYCQAISFCSSGKEVGLEGIYGYRMAWITASVAGKISMLRPSDQLTYLEAFGLEITLSDFLLAAYGLVEDINMPKGGWLLQTAAGSVLGRIVIALAKRRGVKTINVVRRSEQKQELLDLG